MTDHELQDLLDRIERDDATESVPDAVADSPDLRAYQMLYQALGEEPDGELSPDFAERVADRVMPAPEAERFPWLEWIAPPMALIVAFIATMLMIPTVLQTGAAALELMLDPLQTAWSTYRLDIMLAVGAILLLVDGIDRFLISPRRHQHAPSVHS